MKTLTVIGRRWFQRTYGNTYHTAEIIVDGKPIAKTDKAYGYGDQYEQSAFDYLEYRTDLLPTPRERTAWSIEALWVYCERNGITYYRNAIDVSREKDL